MVAFVGNPPPRKDDAELKGRRPVVAFMDTGCGEHAWLDRAVKRQTASDPSALGVTDPDSDPEAHPDLAGPYDGFLDAAAGHGTFVAGIIHQACPDATLLPIRVADSMGTLLESDFLDAVKAVVDDLEDYVASGGKKGRVIDVLNISLGYYHETRRMASSTKR